jgi:hypothetical protein
MQLTLASWVKRGRDENWERIMGKYYWSSSEEIGSWVMHFGDSNNIICRFNINNNWQQVVSPSNSIATSNNQKWQHVACTYDGARLAIYIDGQKKSEVFASGLISTSDNPITIGVTTNPELQTQSPFSGDMDDLRIYNYALADSEINQLWQLGKTIGKYFYMPVYMNENFNEDGSIGLTCGPVEIRNYDNTINKFNFIPDQTSQKAEWLFNAKLMNGSQVISNYNFEFSSDFSDCFGVACINNRLQKNIFFDYMPQAQVIAIYQNQTGKELCRSIINY